MTAVQRGKEPVVRVVILSSCHLVMYTIAMIAALIFDFDGLLVDTETPAFESWRAIYGEYGHELTLDQWQGALGTNHGFDAIAYLATLVEQPLDRAEMLARRQARKRA